MIERRKGKGKEKWVGVGGERKKRQKEGEEGEGEREEKERIGKGGRKGGRRGRRECLLNSFYALDFCVHLVVFLCPSQPTPACMQYTEGIT